MSEATVQRMEVTPAQVAAAKLNIKLSNELGEPIDPVIEAIANATVRGMGRATAAVSEGAAEKEAPAPVPPAMQDRSR